MTPNSTPPPRSLGFTLIEVAISVAVVVSGLLAVVALASSAIAAVTSVRQNDAAWRLRSTITNVIAGGGAQFEEIYGGLRDEKEIYAFAYGLDFTGAPDSSFALAEFHTTGVFLATSADLPAAAVAAEEVYRLQITLFDPETGDEVEVTDLPVDAFLPGSSGSGVGLVFYYEAEIQLFQLPSGLDLTLPSASLPEGKLSATFRTTLRP